MLLLAIFCLLLDFNNFFGLWSAQDCKKRQRGRVLRFARAKPYEPAAWLHFIGPIESVQPGLQTRLFARFDLVRHKLPVQQKNASCGTLWTFRIDLMQIFSRKHIHKFDQLQLLQSLQQRYQG